MLKVYIHQKQYQYMQKIEVRERIPIEEEEWFKSQTERILSGIDKREPEIRENNRKLEVMKREYQINVKLPYIGSLKLSDYEEEEESPGLQIKEFAYSEVNPLYSLYTVNRIDRELREREIREGIANKNRLTDLFYLFNFLFKNPNKDLIRKYKKEERERKERIRVFKDNRKIEDRIVKVSYDYTVSSQKLKEDRNTGAAHNTSKRQLKQIEIKALQYKALRKVHTILRDLKENRGAEPNFLKSVVIYCGDVIKDSEPEEVLSILTDLQKEMYREIKAEEPIPEIENLKKYMEYSNRLESLREFGVSFNLLVNRDKRELKELKKAKKTEEEL